MDRFSDSTWSNRALYGAIVVPAVFAFAGWSALPLWLAISLWLSTFVLLVIYPLLTRSTPDAKPERKPFFINLVIDVGAAGLVVVAMFVGFILFNLLIEQLGTPPELPMTTEFARGAATDSSYLLYLMLFLAVFVAPWAEEVFFRGFLLNAFRSHMRLSLAILGQALIFGLMHLTWSPLYAAVTAGIGLVLGVLYVVRDSLRASIIAHGMWNGLFAFMILFTILQQGLQTMIGVSGETDEDRYVITYIVPSSPAQNAGLQLGDEIVSLGGVEIDTHDELTHEVQSREPDDEINVEFVRGGQTYELQLRLSSRREVLDQNGE